MNLQTTIELDEKYYMNTFGKRTPVSFEKGEGIYLFDENGKKYYDFFAGIAVSVAGHNHPHLSTKLKEQIDNGVLHTSSLYYIKNQAMLAQKLAMHSCADRVFFCSTGAEANEGAMKLAKQYYYKRNLNNYKFITLTNSFHGRTLATTAATGQEKYQAPYRSIVNGFANAPINDFEALLKLIDSETAGIILEPVQGESGVHVLDKDYVQKVRKLCDEKDIVLIFDEVQTGLGRTGKWFGYELLGVEPDIFTLAKALGGGVPIGAICAKEKFSVFTPGDHGTTFGGNPLATAAGLAVIDILENENLVEHADEMGKHFENALSDFKMRRAGLMIGIEVTDAPKIRQLLFEKGFLVGAVGTNTLRVLPPLIISKSEIDSFATALKEVTQHE